MRHHLLFGLFLVVATGCGGIKYAPVSGKVTMNGKPLANTLVSFQPIAKPGSIEAGPGSSGTTDEQGRFALKVATGENGAVVGKHRVIISQVVSKTDPANDARPTRGGPPQMEKIPARYNSESKETFDVPSGGTDKADFELKSP
jgi:hypothetical protein